MGLTISRVLQRALTGASAPRDEAPGGAEASAAGSGVPQAPVAAGQPPQDRMQRLQQFNAALPSTAQRGAGAPAPESSAPAAAPVAVAGASQRSPAEAARERAMARMARAQATFRAEPAAAQPSPAAAMATRIAERLAQSGPVTLRSNAEVEDFAELLRQNYFAPDPSDFRAIAQAGVERSAGLERLDATLLALNLTRDPHETESYLREHRGALQEALQALHDRGVLNLGTFKVLSETVSGANSPERLLNLAGANAELRADEPLDLLNADDVQEHIRQLPAEQRMPFFQQVLDHVARSDQLLPSAQRLLDTSGNGERGVLTLQGIANANRLLPLEERMASPLAWLVHEHADMLGEQSTGGQAALQRLLDDVNHRMGR